MISAAMPRDAYLRMGDAVLISAACGAADGKGPGLWEASGAGTLSCLAPGDVTGAIKRYPRRGTVSMKRGLSEFSSIAARSFLRRSEERRVGKECRARWSP